MRTRGGSVGARVIPPALRGSLGFLLNKPAHEYRELLDPRLEPLGLTGKTLAMLKLLEAAPGPLTQHRIGALARVDRSTIVTLVDLLEGRGFVSRGKVPGDRRAHAVALTPKGRAALPAARRVEARVQAAFLSGLAPAERRTLMGLLARLLQASRSKEEA